MKAELVLGILIVLIGLVVCYTLGIIPMMADLFNGLIDLGVDMEHMGTVQVIINA